MKPQITNETSNYMKHHHDFEKLKGRDQKNTQYPKLYKRP